MWCTRHVFSYLLLPVCWLQIIAAIQVDVNSPDSLKAASKIIAKDLLTFYHGNEPGNAPGTLFKPYYWWEAGAMWGELIEYWASTGDSSYNDLVSQAVLFQTGQDRNFMPQNASQEEGNDDQAFWALTAMTATELNFPDPPPDKPQWLALVQAVFNQQTRRWDMDSCAGGLRWQITFTQPGYNYKNTISNAALFQIAARLARYTGNETYHRWADKTWDWLASTPNLTPDFTVNDGSDVKLNCTDANGKQWSYNYGALLMGAANMYDITSGKDQDLWKTRIQGLWKQMAARFFPAQDPNKAPLNPNIMVEVECEWAKNCNPDQTSFKAYTTRWMAATIQLAPFMKGDMMPKLQASAQGAAQQCSGAASKTMCGRNWNAAAWDQTTGVGEQMSALAVIQANLISQARKPITEATGGTSKGDPNAGSKNTVIRYTQITQASKAAAGILTTLIMVALFGGGWWLIDDGYTEVAFNRMSTRFPRASAYIPSSGSQVNGPWPKDKATYT